MQVDYDYYRLYFADEYGYSERIICYSMEQVMYEINKADMFDRYLVIGHITQLDQDEVVASGTIEINKGKTHKKGR